MHHVRNPASGEVRYVTHNYAAWLKRYGWEPATFEQFMTYARSKL